MWLNLLTCIINCNLEAIGKRTGSRFELGKRSILEIEVLKHILLFTSFRKQPKEKSLARSCKSHPAGDISVRNKVNPQILHFLGWWMKIKMFMLVLVCVTVTVSCTYLAITATVKHTDFKMLNINDGVAESAS